MFCKIDNCDSILVLTCPSVPYQGYVIVHFIFHVSFSQFHIYMMNRDDSLAFLFLHFLLCLHHTNTYLLIVLTFALYSTLLKVINIEY